MARIIRPPALGRVRLACVADAPLVLDLVNESMAKNFRIKSAGDIVYMIENCILSICQLDINDTVVGFLAARDYPPIPAVNPQAWEEYFWAKYKAIEMTARNTLFLCLLCWDTAYSRNLVDNMLKTIFMHDPYLNYVAMVKSLPAYPLLIPGQSRAEGAFRRIQAMEKGIPGEMLPALCLAERSEVCPRLRIRRAVEEDNDDIVPIIERHAPRLRQMYGEFYVSELISRHPESERVLLVCEHKELAVGVMCLNTQINYAALEESYELGPFCGLRHVRMTPSNLKREPGSPVSWASYNKTESMAGDFMDFEEQERKTKVSWLYEEECFMVPDVQAIQPRYQTSSWAQLDALSFLEDEEDDFDFDIVNIHAGLLKVPEALSCESIERGLEDNFAKVLDESSKPKVVEEDIPQKDRFMPRHFERLIEPVRYSGPPNAFLLELFAMHADYDERYGFDMLEAAYELFPDRDYCVMCLPSKHPAFPLLEHFTLVTPFGIRRRFVNESLYVAHINSVRGNIGVRPGEASDMEYLKQVLGHAARADSHIELFKSSLDSHILSSFMLLSQKQPIGMVVLGPLQDGTSIRSQYALEPEPRWPGTDAMVLAGVMSPAFEPHGRWYIRDMLRQSRYTTLFWTCQLFARGDSNPARNMMSLSGHMAPVLPRRCVPNISGNKDLEQMLKNIATPFALWVIERPLTSMPKVLVNNNIVVVGASRTGLAFIEKLIMGPASQYLTFTNITLVSEQGLPTSSDSLQAAETCVPRQGRYTDRYLKSIPFYFYVDVMAGVMVNIDRKMKCIHLKSGGVKFYDELVLTCGHQFQHPHYLHEARELVKVVEKGKPCERILMDNPEYQPDRVADPPNMPENLMLINSLAEANNCLKKLRRMISEQGFAGTDEHILVYGECIEAYNCLAALLELGVSPEKVIFIESFPPEDDSAMRVNCFNNEIVDERVQGSIEALGIQVLRKYSLTGWKQVDGWIVEVHVMTSLHAKRLPCFAFFYYGLKAININAFKAINESGLVYDGGLVVGPSFDTNDPNIYGAGPCAKYSRRLYADRHRHTNYCSEDVGEALAQIFLNKMDPFDMGNTNVHSEAQSRYTSSILLFRGGNASVTKIPVEPWNRWEPVMKFESPIVQYSVLPGPLYYLKVRKPGLEIPMEVQLCLPHQGHTLVTDKSNNYFRLQLNVLHCVETITCLSNKQISPELLSQLYGKHEAFFDKLLARFKLELIEDLFEFFMQPWMSALYQDTFTDLIRDINEQDLGTVYDLLKSHFSLLDKSRRLTVGLQTSEDDANCFEEMGHKEVRRLGTFRSVIEKFVVRSTSSVHECGQSALVRNEASAFWKTVHGEKVVHAYLGRYLLRHSVSNPHYARLLQDEE